MKPGDIVEMDGLLAVVVGIPELDDTPEGHVKVWFGDPHALRISEGGQGGRTPETWTVPVDYFTPAKPAKVNH